MLAPRLLSRQFFCLAVVNIQSPNQLNKYLFKKNATVVLGLLAGLFKGNTDIYSLDYSRKWRSVFILDPQLSG